VILVGSGFWGPLVEWMKRCQLKDHDYIGQEDLSLFTITDDVSWVAGFIAEQYERALNELPPQAPPGEPWDSVTAEGTMAGRTPRRARASVTWAANGRSSGEKPCARAVVM